MISQLDPELISLGVAALMVLALNGFRLFFVLSAKGNLLWIGISTFLTVRFFLLRDGTTYGIENTVLLAVCAIFLLMLLFVPGLIQQILKRVGI